MSGLIFVHHSHKQKPPDLGVYIPAFAFEQTSRRSSQGRTAPPSPSKAPGVANHQFSVARRAVAVASPYCRRRPQTRSSRQPKSPRPRFPARGKVRRNSQGDSHQENKMVFMKNRPFILTRLSHVAEPFNSSH